MEHEIKSNLDRVLILGASGLLGSALFERLFENCDVVVHGVFRTYKKLAFFSSDARSNVTIVDNILDEECLLKVFCEVKPTVVVNCVSSSPKLADQKALLGLINTFVLFPKTLARVCKNFNCRLIHISSDGVFSGRSGNYSELDYCDAKDCYGKAKILGEDIDGNCLVVRMSVIGHELDTRKSFLEWFLSQKDDCFGYSRYIFSGITSVEFARIFEQYILPNRLLSGTIHIGAEAISKFDLLCLIKTVYTSAIKIIPIKTPVADRSLNTDLFYTMTDYRAPSWPMLITEMYKKRKKSNVIGLAMNNESN